VMGEWWFDADASPCLAVAKWNQKSKVTRPGLFSLQASDRKCGELKSCRQRWPAAAKTPPNNA
jgi:hypothetical protein